MPTKACVLLIPLLLALASGGCGRSRESDRPNLLLVSIDTLRPDRLACYGGEADVGRNLCGLADPGLRYAWAFATAPATAPSVASLLTSLYPKEHRVTERYVSFLEKDVLTVSEVLREAGYDTAAFVCNPVLGPDRQLGQGFAIYDARMTRREVNRPGFAEREAAAATDAALAWARVAQEPFFLWVHYQDPHGPYDPPDYGGRLDPPGGTVLPLLEDHSGRGGIPAYQAIPGMTTVEGYEGRYLDEIRYLDGHLRRLVEGLDALGRPLGVLATADHGEAFGEDGYYFAHGHSLGLDQIRVPLVWRPPGERRRGVVRTPVSTLDAAPTLVAAAGLEVPAAFEGRVLPESDAAQAEPRAVFAEHRLRAAVLVEGLYYARDRRAIDGVVPDRVSGGELRALPPRIARLPEDGPPPAPTLAEDHAETQPLEDALALFLSGAAEDGAVRGALTEETREQLRALGYLE